MLLTFGFALIIAKIQFLLWYVRNTKIKHYGGAVVGAIVSQQEVPGCSSQIGYGTFLCGVRMHVSSGFSGFLQKFNYL